MLKRKNSIPTIPVFETQPFQLPMQHQFLFSTKNVENGLTPFVFNANPRKNQLLF